MASDRWYNKMLLFIARFFSKWKEIYITHNKDWKLTDSLCEISSRPINNVYVKSSWSMSNFQNMYIMYSKGLCKIEIGLWYHKS
jgi:hypothetical protein